MRNILYISLISVFSFLIFSKNPWAIIPALGLLIFLYLPSEKFKFLAWISAIASIFLFMAYLPQSLSEAAGLMLSYLILAEFILKGSKYWRDWCHIGAILIMADSAIYGLDLLYFIISLVFLTLSLIRVYYDLYPGSQGKIIKFLPVHLAVVFILTPVIFISIPRRGSYFITGGFGRGSGLSDIVDLNFSGKIKDSTALAMQIEGENIPVYWKAKVYYLYKKGRWYSGEKGEVKTGREIVPLPKLDKTLNVRYLLKYPRLIPFPENTSVILIYEGAYWSHRDFLEFGGAVRTYRIARGKGPSEITVLRPLNDHEARFLGKENVWKYRPVSIDLSKEEWSRIKRVARELKGSNLEDTLSNIEQFLTDNYEYTTSLELLKKEPVYNFLFFSKKGHCELFATASSVILKALGWDARFVTGFRIREIGDDWAIARMRDAHAWVEVWNGKKWIKFDPSPGKETEKLNSNPIIATWDRINSLWGRYVVGFSATYQFYVYSWLKRNHRKIIVLGLIAVLIYLILNFLPAKKKGLIPKAMRTPSPWYYRKLISIAGRMGIRKLPYLTPLEFGRLLGEDGEEVVYFYYRERFGKIELSREDHKRLKEVLKRIENRAGKVQG